MSLNQIRDLSIFVVLSMAVNSFANAQLAERKELSKCSRLQFGVAHTGYNYGNRMNYTKGVSFQHNYCIIPGKKMGYGLGLGLASYPDQTFLPLYLDVLSGFNKKFFLNVQGGYSIGWKRKLEYYDKLHFGGGTYGSFGIGCKLNMKMDYKFYFQCSYKFQTAKLREEKQTTLKVYYNSIALSVGILFQQ